MSSFLFFPTVLVDPAEVGRQAYNATLAGNNQPAAANDNGAAQAAEREYTALQAAINRPIEEGAATAGVFGSRDNAETRFGEGYEIALGAVLFILTILPFMTGHTEGTTFEWGLVMTIMYSTIGLFLYVYFRRVPKGGRVTILDKYSDINFDSLTTIFQGILYYYFFAPAKFAANVFYILEMMIVRKLFGYKDPGANNTNLKTFDFYQNTLASIKMRIQPYIDSSELLRILFVGPAYAKRRTLFSENPIDRTYNGSVNREVLLSTIILAFCISVPAVITAARGEEMSRSYVKYSYVTITVVSLIIFLLVYGTLQGYSTGILDKISGNLKEQFVVGAGPSVPNYDVFREREEELRQQINDLEASKSMIPDPNSTDGQRQIQAIDDQIEPLRVRYGIGLSRLSNDQRTIAERQLGKLESFGY